MDYDGTVKLTTAHGEIVVNNDTGDILVRYGEQEFIVSHPGGMVYPLLKDEYIHLVSVFRNEIRIYRVIGFGDLEPVREELSKFLSPNW
jgi:hypothetical protein